METLRSRLAGYGVYVFRAGPFLIDAGFGNAQSQLLRWPGLAGATTCLLTHHDEDHSGNAAALTRYGITVAAPSRVVDRLRRRAPIRLYRRWMWGRGAFAALELLKGEAIGDGWRLLPVYTPGHSDDHYVYYEPDRRLVFSADLYIGRRVRVAKANEDLSQLLDSLRSVRDLDPMAMYCSHRGRIERPAAALQDKIDWIEELIGRAKELEGQGMRPDQIARQLLGRDKIIDWASRFEYSRRNLVELALKA